MQCFPLIRCWRVHLQAEVVFFTNQNQRREDPPSIINDMLQGLPDEILEWNNDMINTGWKGGFLQDPIRVEENCLMPDYWEQSNW